MASACVNNISPENLLDCPATFQLYDWQSGKVSISREAANGESSKIPRETLLGNLDPDVSGKDAAEEFAFRLEDPVTMLPADELFSGGKLMPLQISTTRSAAPVSALSEVRPREMEASKGSWKSEVSDRDSYSSFSPRAPTCSIRWKNILRLKKLQFNSKADLASHPKTTSSSVSAPTSRSLVRILNRSSKSSNSSSTSADNPCSNLPFLKDSDSESVSTSSRLSLSSSSSGHDHEDLPKFLPSLSSEKSHRMPTVLTDSPRLNSSGKVVFQGLERSSSSPGSFNGGPSHKNKGIQRSYSAHVRVAPVLNVPVCSLKGSPRFGFPLFSSSPQKREGGGGRIRRRNSKNNHRSDQA